ncbi:MAG TPA: hypothetical protein VKX17_28660 [Planctomycetota bacterium]|nr:hypothetical protein [Planctomycetota bacterium]
MPKWQKKTFKLKPNHGWTAKPGNNIFAADRGALKFEFPSSWLIKPGKDGEIQFRDKPEPDDNATLAASVNYLNDRIDWSGVPLLEMIRDLAKHDKRKPFFIGDAIEIRKRHLHAAWTEIHFMDPNEKREAHGRMCVAVQSNVQVLITFDFWHSDRERMIPVWNDVMETLVVGDYIANPFKAE